jgi:hypothetical protein
MTSSGSVETMMRASRWNNSGTVGCYFRPLSPPPVFIDNERKPEFQLCTASTEMGRQHLNYNLRHPSQALMERNSAVEYDLVSCQLQCESRFAECPFVERECLRKRLHRFYSGLIPAPLHSQLQNSIRIKWSGPSILILLYPTSTLLVA